MTPARSPYGDLADDVALLATVGQKIERHDGMYRLNGATEKLTAAMVRGMAAEVRNRRLDAATAPRATKAGHGSYPQRPYAERPDKFWRAVGPSDEQTKSCGGRGVRTTEDNPAPRGHVPSVGAGHDQQTRAVADRRDRCAPDVGNVVEPETDPGRPPRPSPPQDLITPTKLQGPMPNAGDGGETAATRCRPSPTNSDAAPSGRADVVHTDVPPAATPQTASGPPTAAVTPAPESGASAGTHKLSRTRKSRKSLGIPARILALENRNDALERKVAALEALMSMEGLR